MMPGVASSRHYVKKKRFSFIDCLFSFSFVYIPRKKGAAMIGTCYLPRTSSDMFFHFGTLTRFSPVEETGSQISRDLSSSHLSTTTWPTFSPFSSSMALTLRVRIQYTAIHHGDGSFFKFVYLIDSPTKTTIRVLITLLQEFISSHFGAENLRLMQLVTEDGYLLMEDDLCAHVLISNEQLVCVDMYQFIMENLASLNTDDAWFSLEQQDSNDESVTRKLAVGLNSRRQVYVYLFGNDDVQALHLFSVPDLLRLADDRNHGKHSIVSSIRDPWHRLDL